MAPAVLVEDKYAPVVGRRRRGLGSLGEDIAGAFQVRGRAGYRQTSGDGCPGGGCGQDLALRLDPNSPSWVAQPKAGLPKSAPPLQVA